MAVTPKEYWRKLVVTSTITVACSALSSNLWADIGSALEQEGQTWTTEGDPNIITLENASDYVDGDALRFQGYGTDPENRSKQLSRDRFPLNSDGDYVKSKIMVGSNSRLAPGLLQPSRLRQTGRKKRSASRPLESIA